MPPKRSYSSTTDTQLGLTPDDLATFRRHQHLALGQAPTTSTSRINATAEAQRSFVLDPSSLQLMTRHFDRIIITIQQRLDTLQRETQDNTQRQASRARVSVQAANAEIARMHSILRQIDELETEFDKIRRIRDIVRFFRGRIEAMERRLAS
ncbi:hypothetical protein BDV97DRAFT_188725 [Delphinella strobiligena]|nr:hypothetical protein BDV97DRAFT_188725 [Delphinella strobiligena]